MPIAKLSAKTLLVFNLIRAALNETNFGLPRKVKPKKVMFPSLWVPVIFLVTIPPWIATTSDFKSIPGMNHTSSIPGLSKGYISQDSLQPFYFMDSTVIIETPARRIPKVRLNFLRALSSSITRAWITIISLFTMVYRTRRMTVYLFGWCNTKWCISCI